MNKILLLLGLIILVSSSSAQNPLGQEGNQFSLSTGYNATGFPIYIAYEMGILESVTFGLEGTYRSYGENTDTANLNHSIVGFSFFGNYYFNKWLKLDEEKWGVYGGLNLGYYKWFSPDNYFEPGNSSSTLAIGAQLGGRYYFGDWAVFLEAVGSTENAGLKIGGSYRFN